MIAGGGARVAAVLAATAGVAVADDRPGEDTPVSPPDARAVAQAREANFEPLSVREGFAIGAAIGPSMQLGFRIQDASGTGGGFDLRVGTVASPRWVWLLELAATVYRQQSDGGGVRLNQSALLTFGGQYYLRDALWLRAGSGLATFTRRNDGARADETFYGLGSTAAAGYDLYHDGGLAWSFEVLALGAMYRDGVVLGSSFQLGLSWY